MVNFSKNIFFILVITFCLTVVSKSDNKILYIDLDYVFQNTNLGKSIIEDLNLINTKNNKKFEKKENELKQMEIDLINSKNVISETEFEAKKKDLKIKIDNFLLEKKNSINDYENMKKNRLEEFFKKINPIIENYMRDNSIDILIEKKYIFISKSEYDISSDIVKLINN